MKIYDLLFYASYKLAQKSRNFDDTPVLGGIVMVSGCILINIITFFLLLSGFHIYTLHVSSHRYTVKSVLGGILFMAFLLIYYKWKGRYKRILAKYENKKTLHPWLIVIIYWFISFVLVNLAAFFKNRAWIFSGIP